MADRRTDILHAAVSVIARRGVRGLRVEEVGQEASVAVSLIYYYFGSRTGLVRATLDLANERLMEDDVEVSRAGASTGAARLRLMLAGEFTDEERAREGSIVWGEVLASAVFEPELREQLQVATATWTKLVATALTIGRADGSIDPAVDPARAAERLTALVDGLSARWLAGILSTERALKVVDDAVDEFAVRAA